MVLHYMELGRYRSNKPGADQQERLELCHIKPSYLHDLLSCLAGCLPIDMQIMLRAIHFVLRCLPSPNNVTRLLMTLALKGRNSSESKSIKYYLYKRCLRNDVLVFTNCSSTHFRRSMERNHAADICNKPVTTVQHIWEILDEKATPRVVSRTEVDILLNHLCT